MTVSRAWGRAFRVVMVAVVLLFGTSLLFSRPGTARASRMPSTVQPLGAVPAAGGARLQADSATLGGLVYEGNETTATAAGDVVAMKFTTTSAAFQNLLLAPLCPAGGGAGPVPRLATTAASAAAPAPGGLTFWASSVVATVNGATATWTPAAPPGAPAVPPVALGDLPVSGLDVALVQAVAPGLVLGGGAGPLGQYAEFCG